MYLSNRFVAFAPCHLLAKSCLYWPIDLSFNGQNCMKNIQILFISVEELFDAPPKPVNKLLYMSIQKFANYVHNKKLLGNNFQ